jgi:RNA polymerase sigma factor (sigma-70 family)
MITQDLLKEYATRPTAEALVALLKACADPVYNVCFQVLRHRQDAEDAAQTVLLKIMEEVPSSSEIERFDRWMYRVALNAALNFRKQRARRIARDNRRALMNDVEYVPNDAREAIYEAIGDLDDDARCLIVQHFLEGRSLEEIARERGCSAVAVWKRIERAKGSIKGTLLAAGATAFLSGFDQVFGAAQAVRAPSTLVSQAILDKAAAIAAGAKAGAAAATYGGLVMTGKGVSISVVAAFSILFFAVGAGGGFLARSSRTDPEPAAAVARKPAPRPAADSAAISESSIPPATSPASPSPAPVAAAAEIAGPDALASGLKSIGTLLLEAKKLSEKNDRRAEELYKRLNREWRAIQAAALGEAASLFAFLREPQNKEILVELLGLIVSYELGPSTFTGNGQADLPAPVADAMAYMLSDGDKAQKLAVLRWLSAVTGPGRDVLSDRCLSVLLSERDSEVLAMTLNTLHVFDPKLNAKLEQRLDVVRNVWQNSKHWQVREQCLESLGGMNSPTGQALFIEKMEEILRTKDKMVGQYIPQILGPRLQSLKLGEEEPYVPVLKTALSATSEGRYFERYLDVALYLPPAKAADVLESAREHCPTPAIRSGVERALELLRNGETRANVVRQVLMAKP